MLQIKASYFYEYIKRYYIIAKSEYGVIAINIVLIYINLRVKTNFYNTCMLKMALTLWKYIPWKLLSLVLAKFFLFMTIVQTFYHVKVF